MEDNMKKIKLLNYLFVLLTVAVFMIAGCGGGDSDAEDDQDLDTEETQEEQGDLVISLTDAPGDFVCYTVDVLSQGKRRPGHGPAPGDAY